VTYVEYICHPGPALVLPIKLSPPLRARLGFELGFSVRKPAVLEGGDYIDQFERVGGFLHESWAVCFSR
jgi:hypothetical protein